MRQTRSLDGDVSGAFAQTALARLELALAKERRRLGRSNDVRDIVMLELDALTLMLLGEAVLAPIALLSLGDLLLMVLFAAVLSLVAFGLLLSYLRMLERSIARRRDRLRAMDDEMLALRRPRNARKN